MELAARPGSGRARLSIALIGTGCALAIGACGGSGNPSSAVATGGSSQSATMVKFSACMRSPGVPGFPDPTTSQGPNSFGIDGYSFSLPSNLNLQSPAYEAADKQCGSLIGGSSSTPRNPAVLAKAREAAIARAQCMREHGVPSFPDPILSGNAQGITARSGGPGINPRSPAFQHAAAACQHP
jgi:hypothetical protein